MLVALLLAAATLRAGPSDTAEARVLPLVGEPGDFLRATHVRIDGSWFEIGHELARLGLIRHHGGPTAVGADDRVREQRAWFSERYPAQLERMRGLASFFGLEPETEEFVLDGFPYATPRAGCTVAYYPPATTEDGRGVLARNFDFTTGTFEGKQPAVGEPIACAEPYVLELHPEGGYASLALVAFDLFGVLDGMNSEGLTVALLADDELFATGQARPTPGAQAGLGVLQVGRFLLDTCKDAGEAEAALRAARLYYTSIPCHYVVADRHGRAFVWENAVDMKGGHVIEDAGEVLVSTNYLQFLHPEPVEAGGELFERQARLANLVGTQGKLSLDEIRANASCVAASGRAPAGRAPGRTLWHAFYFPAELRMEVDFYLGDGPDGARRSAPQSFTLASSTR
jgi:acyl-CoA:6-aminopenicillanic acid acyl transferase